MTVLPSGRLRRGGAVLLAIALVTGVAAWSGGLPGRPGLAAAAAARPGAIMRPAAGRSAAGRSGCDDQPWHRAPAHQRWLVAVPPMPVARVARAGQHTGCRFDRLVIGFSGAVPSAVVRYIPGRAAGPAARRLAAPGDRYLLVTLYPARAHRLSGAAALRPQVAPFPFRMLHGYALVSDFEGVLSLVAVVRGTPRLRLGLVGRRLYLDLRA